MQDSVLVGSLQRILNVQYSVPDIVQISPECHDLISRIFVFDPAAVSNFLLLLNLNLLLYIYKFNTSVREQLEKDDPKNAVFLVFCWYGSKGIPIPQCFGLGD